MATKAVAKEETAVGGIPVYDGTLEALNDDSDMTEIMRENLGDDGFRPADLTRVTFPRESAVWDVGGEMRTELRGVPLRQVVTRAFYLDEYGGGNEPPDCSSTDGLTGVPKENTDGLGYAPNGADLSWGGACVKCPLNQWGSAWDKNGQPSAGKACREYRQIALLEADAALPVIVRLPPTQLRAWREFCVAVTKARLRISQVITSLTISKSRDNVLSLDAVLVAVLPSDMAEKVSGLSKSMNLLAAPQREAAPETSGYLDDGAPDIDPDELPF